MQELMDAATQTLLPTKHIKQNPNGRDFATQADLENPSLTRYEMELEKIIRMLWEPLVKKHSKEYLLSQVVSRDKKELVQNILKENTKKARTAKEEFLDSLTRRLTVQQVVSVHIAATPRQAAL